MENRTLPPTRSSDRARHSLALLAVCDTRNVHAVYELQTVARMNRPIRDAQNDMLRGEILEERRLILGGKFGKRLERFCPFDDEQKLRLHRS